MESSHVQTSPQSEASSVSLKPNPVYSLSILKGVPTKDQLISKCPFPVFKSPKKPTKIL